MNASATSISCLLSDFTIIIILEVKTVYFLFQVNHLLLFFNLVVKTFKQIKMEKNNTTHTQITLCLLMCFYVSLCFHLKYMSMYKYMLLLFPIQVAITLYRGRKPRASITLPLSCPTPKLWMAPPTG